MEQQTKICSTRAALIDMLDTASRKLNKALTNKKSEDVERAKEAIASLNDRLRAHCNVHRCEAS